MARPRINVSLFHPFVTDYGWTKPELVSVGLGRHAADRVIASAPPLSIPAGGREIPVGGTKAFQAALSNVGLTAPELDEVTSVVSINAPSRQTLAEGLYLRDRSRGKYVRPAAGYLATGTNRTLDLEYPILGHGLARNGLVHLQFADPHTQAIYDAARQALGTAIFTDWWPGDVDVFVLGDPQPISIPIGTAPIRGTRSYLRRILHTAPQLDGQPTV